MKQTKMEVGTCHQVIRSEVELGDGGGGGRWIMWLVTHSRWCKKCKKKKKMLKKIDYFGK